VKVQGEGTLVPSQRKPGHSQQHRPRIAKSCQRLARRIVNVFSTQALHPIQTMTPSALSVQQVFHFVGPKRSRLSVLEDVSFDLEKGEFLCVMGPSGSGKSTLLHLVAGLDSPDAGVIKLAGVELSSNAPAKRTKTRRDGIGTMHYANGNIYTGRWRRNKKQGRGKMTYADGNVEEGSWKGGIFTG